MEPACASSSGQRSRVSEPRSRTLSSFRDARWLFVLSLIVCVVCFPAAEDSGSSQLSSQHRFSRGWGAQLAYGQVVGVDLGSEFVKVALVAAGRPMEIILNSASKRKTSHAVSFADAEKRDMGDEGAAAASKRPHHVFMHSNLFLGRHATEVDSSFTVQSATSPCQGDKDVCSGEQQPRYLPLKLQAEQSLLQEVGYPHGYYPYRLYADRQRHTVAFLAREGMYLSAEMVTANFLSYLRKMAAQAANVPPTAAIGVVISVPCRFSQRQRQALRDAAEIAGLRPISLVHHAAAAATQHALDTPLPPSSSSSSAAGNSKSAGETSGATSEQAEAAGSAAAPGPSTKLFVDVGSAAVDFSVIRFEPVPVTSPSSKKAKDAASRGPLTLSVQMLSCETLYGIGGHNVDIGLAELMREAFEKRHPAQGDLRQTPRALKKLLRQAVLSKHILSANKKTQFSVEGLLTTESGAELDLNELVDRSHVESVLERMQLRSRMQQALQKTLQQAQLELKDIDQIELLGGGWRVPHVQQELTALLDGRAPGMHLNGDEAMATGAAFIAANNTATFRVKKYYLADITPFEYSLKITYRPSAGATAGAGEEAAATTGDTPQQPPQSESEEQVEETSSPQDGTTTEEKGQAEQLVEKVVTLYARNSKFGGAATSKTVSVRTAENFTVDLLEDGSVIESIAIRGVPEAVARQQAAAAAVEELEKQRQQQEGTAQEEAATAAPGSSRVVEKKILGDPKVSLVFAVDGSGVLAFDRAYASFTLQVTEEEMQAANTSATPAAGSPPPEGTAAEGAAAEDKGEKSSSSSPAGETETGAAAKEEEKKKEETPQTAAAPTRVQKRKQVVEPLIGETALALPLPLSQEEKQQLRQQLSELEAADLQVHLFSEAINRLESFIYATRSALDEAAVTEVMQEEDLEKLRQQLQDDEDYLYSQAKQEGLEAVKKRQQELEAVVMPIQHRAAERTARPEVVKAVEEGLAAAADRLQRISKLQEQQKDWPPQDKLKKAEEVKASLEKWWEEKLEEQKKRRDWEEPAFTRGDARKKLRELDAALTAVEEAPKPAASGAGKKSGAAAAARRKKAARDAAAASKEKAAPQAADAPPDSEQQQQQQAAEEGKEEGAAEPTAAAEEPGAESAAAESDAAAEAAPEMPQPEQQQEQQGEGNTAGDEDMQKQEQQEKPVEHSEEL